MSLTTVARIACWDSTLLRFALTEYAPCSGRCV